MGLHCLCGENKSADQLWGYRAADLRRVFGRYAKSRLSHDGAHMANSLILI